MKKTRSIKFLSFILAMVVMISSLLSHSFVFAEDNIIFKDNGINFIYEEYLNQEYNEISFYEAVQKQLFDRAYRNHYYERIKEDYIKVLTIVDTDLIVENAKNITISVNSKLKYWTTIDELSASVINIADYIYENREAEPDNLFMYNICPRTIYEGLFQKSLDKEIYYYEYNKALDYFQEQTGASPNEEIADEMAGYYKILSRWDLSQFGVNVKYNQAEARKYLDLINKFRAGDNTVVSNHTDTKTWVYNKKGEKQYVDPVGALEYNYALEEYAMLRAAEAGVYMTSGHTTPSGLGCFNAAALYFYKTQNSIDYSEGVSQSLTNHFVNDVNTVFKNFAEETENYSGQGHRRTMLKADYKYFGCACCEFDSGYSVFVIAYAGENFDLFKEQTNYNNNFQKVSVVAQNPVFQNISGENISLNIGETYSVDNIKTKADFRARGTIKNKNAAVFINNLSWSIENTNIATIENGKIVSKHAGKTNLVSEFAEKTITVPITVNPIEINNSNSLVTGIEENYQYSGIDLTPVPTVEYQGKKLIKDTDYTVSYSNNKPSQTNAKITITGINDYKGTLAKEFKIVCTHNGGYSGWTITKQASCVEEGIQKRTCSWCGNEDTENIPKTAHTPANAVKEKKIAATCTKEGLYDEVVYCSVCNAEISRETKTIKPIAHNYTLTVTEPTCTEQGFTTYTCSACGDTYVGNYTDAKGHTEVDDVAVAPTCIETGLTAGKHCSVCNTVIVAQEVVPATGHTVVTDKAVVARCTTTGLTEGSHCSVCNTVLVAQEVVPAKGHNLSDPTTTIQPTCTQKGKKESVCVICGETVSEEINTLGHDLSEWKVTTEASCAEKGEKKRNCLRCDYVETQTIEKLNHKYSKIVTKPTCIEQGYTTYTCADCSSLYKDNYTDALGHTVVKDKAVAATFAKTGKTEGSHCKVCGKIIKAQKTIPKLVPSETSLVSVTAKSKGFTVKWKKQTKNTTGYQVQYSTSSSFKSGNKTVTISKNSTTTKSFSKLKAKKKYYVRVRTYKSVNGKKYYSSWSKSKSVTTKK